jgi:hypothetical protein
VIASSDILPLDKVYPLWDAILTSPTSLPLFIAVAILRELRSTLLPLDFNACVSVTRIQLQIQFRSVFCS